MKRPNEKLDRKKLGPFRIKMVRGRLKYELGLPATMNTHPVFHISLLEPAPPGAPEVPETGIQRVDPNTMYDVEEILDYKIQDAQVKYLIKWLDYPHSENTWEPKGNLSCPETHNEFYSQRDRWKDPRQDHNTRICRQS